MQENTFICKCPLRASLTAIFRNPEGSLIPRAKTAITTTTISETMIIIETASCLDITIADNVKTQYQVQLIIFAMSPLLCWDLGLNVKRHTCNGEDIGSIFSSKSTQSPPHLTSINEYLTGRRSVRVYTVSAQRGQNTTGSSHCVDLVHQIQCSTG